MALFLFRNKGIKHYIRSRAVAEGSWTNGPAQGQLPGIRVRIMAKEASYKILGLQPGAGKAEVKKAYRRLAKKYHPDINPTASGAEKFLEITRAYHELTEERIIPYKRDRSYAKADEIIRKERQKARERERKRRNEQEEADRRFRESGWYDLLLLTKYVLHVLVLAGSIAAIVVPILLAFIIEPAVFIATLYFVVIGAFGIWHVCKNRKTWFRLGQFNTNREKIVSWFRKPATHASNDPCYYMKGQKADGRAYRVKLVRIEGIRVVSYGAMDHQATYNNKATSLVIPRSARAELIHRICSLTRIFLIILAIFLFPVSSLFWRLVAGILAAALVSFLLLKISGVKSKTSFLFTPALCIKATAWTFAMLSISHFGPGFDIVPGEYKWIVIAGLFFLLDMLFDLLLGLFPFYQRLFVPLLSQGKVMNRLYKEGFRNYVEYPFFSVFYPFYLWIS